jgi:ribosomal protein S18 acetylase RimI-like enzyme
MQPKLRTATNTDASRVADIYLASRKQYLSFAPLAHSDDAIRLWVKEQLIPTGNVVVASEEESVLGFVAISRQDPHGWIDHIYLDPRRVSMGLGSLLLTEARQLLGPPIRLYTFQQNIDARRFYRHHGFREIELSDGAANEEKTPDVLLEWP